MITVAHTLVYSESYVHAPRYIWHDIKEEKVEIMPLLLLNNKYHS